MRQKPLEVADWHPRLEREKRRGQLLSGSPTTEEMKLLHQNSRNYPRHLFLKAPESARLIIQSPHCLLSTPAIPAPREHDSTSGLREQGDLQETSMRVGTPGVRSTWF